MNFLKESFIGKHWKSSLIIVAILLSIGAGRISTDYLTIGSPDLSVKTNKPLDYNNVSHAINERNETLLLQKTSSGYEVLAVLSSDVSAGISNAYLTQKYKSANQ